jgi:hypothetical protein
VQANARSVLRLAKETLFLYNKISSATQETPIRIAPNQMYRTLSATAICSTEGLHHTMPFCKANSPKRKKY